MKLVHAGINILLLFFLCNLFYGIWQGLPDKKIIHDISRYDKENKLLLKANLGLEQKIHQASNQGPIMQENIRYYSGYVAAKERFYRVKSWFK